MSVFRLVLRATAMAVLTFGWFTVWALGMLVMAPLGQRLHWRDRCLHLWGATLAPALGIHVRREGPVPRGGCLLVANHLSYVDIAVLVAQRPLCFLSKADVRHWPVLGFMARAIGVLFIERENKRSLPQVAARLEHELDRGHCLVVFPEGTSTSGREVLPFRSSLLAPAAEGGLPVAHATLHYATPDGSPPAARAVCWHGDMSFFPHLLGLFRLPRIDATVRFGPEPLVDGDRKILAARLRDAVVARFVPVAQGEG